jgi:hypothetical protein
MACGSNGSAGLAATCRSPSGTASYAPSAWPAFRVLWIINAVTYIFITVYSLFIDPQTARHSWRQGLMFPGAINLAIIIYCCFPRLFKEIYHRILAANRARSGRCASVR